jgi:RHS repeat-associated protein
MPEMNVISPSMMDGLARSQQRNDILAFLKMCGMRVEPSGRADVFVIADAEERRGLLTFFDDGAIRTTTENGLQCTQWFDPYAKLTRIVDQANNEILISYNGKNVHFDAGAGRIFAVHHNAFGLMTAADFPGDRQSAIDWDVNEGEVIADAAGFRFQRLRDEKGRQVGAFDPNGGRHVFRRQDAEEPSFFERVTPGGRCDRFELGSGGKLANWRVNGQVVATASGQSAPGLPERIAFADGRWAEYQAIEGRIVAARCASGDVRLEHDSAGRLVADIQNGAAIRYGRDRTGLLTMLVLPSGERTGYRYDASARLQSIVDWEGRTTRIGWALNGQLAAIVHPNGIGTEIESDSFGRVLAQRTGSARAPLCGARFAYDERDRLVTSDQDGTRFQYSYDDIDRLTAVTTGDPALRESWQLDAMGNRRVDNGRPFAIDADCRITGAGADAIAYDPLGRVAQMTLPNGMLARLTHDGRGQLVRIDFASGGLAEYGYDPFGRRVWKRVNGRVTHYLWAGTTLASEIRDAGPGWTRRDHLFVPGIYYPVAIRVDGRIVRLHCDQRGAPFAATGDGGEVLWRARLKAFGEALIDVGQIDQPWRLPGQYHDEESGLHYNLARHYDPRLGRYLSEDPLFDPVNRGNPYLYAGGDPLGKVDPTGEIAPILAGALIGAAAGAVIGAAVKAYETRGQDWTAERWKELGKAALVGGVVGAVGGATGAGLAGAIGTKAAAIGAIMGIGAIEGAVTSVVQDCADAALFDKVVSAEEMLKNLAVGMGIGTVTAGLGGLVVRRLRKRPPDRRVPSKTVPERRAAAQKIVDEHTFATDKDKAVFYSGKDHSGTKNHDRALADVSRRQAQPIDVLDGGKALNDENLYSKFNPLYAEADIYWSQASEKYAKGASGDIIAHVNGAKSDRVFATIELPILLDNEKVTTINGVPRKFLQRMEGENPGSAFKALGGGN